MSHVNKLLAVRKQQQKEGILVLFLTHERTQDLELKPPQSRGEGTLFCQESISHPSRVLKIKWKIKKGRKVPGSMPPKAAEILLLLWWEAEMVGAIQSHSCFGSCRALLSFQKPCCIQTHLNMATWIPSSHGERPGYSGSIHGCSLEGRRKASTQSVCHTTWGVIFQVGQ